MSSKRFLLSILSVVFFSVAQAQTLKDAWKRANTPDSTGKTTTQKVLEAAGVRIPTAASGLTNADIISGLKEALNVGTERGGARLSAVDGFFKNAALKILLPEEAKDVESTLRRLGMGKLVDNAVLSLNRAAEDATKKAVPIFWSAIKGITIQDGIGILRGGDSAATKFLYGRTVDSLSAAFRPVINTSLAKVNATKNWNAVFTAYNRVSRTKVNPDLAAYVTERALGGIFKEVAAEEAKIRNNPLARTSDLLRRVFGSKY